MDKYKELFSTIDEINELQKKIVVLREDILEEVVHSKKGKVINKYGAFLKVITKNWTYPKTVVEKELIAKRKIGKIKYKLSLIKKCSQDAGRAKFEETIGLRVVSRK